MTVSSTQPPSLIFDCPLAFRPRRGDRLDLLADLVGTETCSTTQVVRHELGQGARQYQELSGALDLDWLNVIPLETVNALTCFAKWSRRLGKSSRNLGEASVFAAAELYGGTAITDDSEAVRVGRAHQLDVHGTIWLLARACRSGKLTEIGASNLIDALQRDRHAPTLHRSRVRHLRPWARAAVAGLSRTVYGISKMASENLAEELPENPKKELTVVAVSVMMERHRRENVDDEHAEAAIAVPQSWLRDRCHLPVLRARTRP